VNIELRDGGVVAVSEAGDPQGRPVVSISGSPGGRVLYDLHARDAAAKGIRLLGYDRPGYGESTRRPGRTVADAAGDVEAIADALELERFAVWGTSGGGPHALACAALLGERVAGAASLAGVAPFDAEDLQWFAGMGDENVQEFTLATHGPGELEPMLRGAAEHIVAGGPQGMAEEIRTLLSAIDSAAFSGALGEFIHANMSAALAPGVGGWIDDDLAFVSPWGFGVEDISVPVLVWQGVEDRFVPSAHGEWLARHVPGAEVQISELDGHLTLYQRRVPEVHAWLLERF